MHPCMERAAPCSAVVGACRESHPGPPLLRRYRRGRNAARAVENSSDEEPLVGVESVADVTPVETGL